MPLFEYRCERCAHLEEVLQKHTDPAPESCPACGAAGTMAKAISLTSFQLKGGGWYKDLYSSSSTKSEGGDAKASTAASTDAGTSPKTAESKPAESKPADTKPASGGPSDSKPAKAASATASTATA